MEGVVGEDQLQGRAGGGRGGGVGRGDGADLRRPGAPRAPQETLLRAWRGLDRFEPRAPADGDGPPAAVERREAIGLAFVAAVQLLAPKQRVVLVLRDVIDWSAREVANLLEESVVAVNSALQRARERVARECDQGSPGRVHAPLDARTEARMMQRLS